MYRTEEDGTVHRAEAGHDGFSKALSMLNPLTPSTRRPNALVHVLSREEKKALERYRLWLTKKRYKAIELARKATYL